MQAPIYLNALRAFEASARHLSFTAAAAELNVTPAAVGQLVRGLEDWLGTPLFLRDSRGGRSRLQPSEAALRALPELSAGFERLALGLERLREGAAQQLLTVTLSPALAAKWLLPRLDGFLTRHPEIDVRLDTNLRPVDFVSQDVDIGIRYGAGEWAGLQSERLMDEEVYPVCTPALQRRTKTLVQLSEATLLHDLSMDERQGFPSWRRWLQLAGAKPASTRRGLRINNSAAVLQAAIDGQGIALARSVMARDDLAAGRLKRLFPHIDCPSPLAYHVVCRPERAAQAKVRAFRDWLFEQAKQG